MQAKAGESEGEKREAREDVLRYTAAGTSLAVQGLRLHASNARGAAKKKDTLLHWLSLHKDL